jgi:hypothetical protein
MICWTCRNSVLFSTVLQSILLESYLPSFLALKSQNSRHTCRSYKNLSLKQFSVRMQETMILGSQHRSKANSESFGRKSPEFTLKPVNKFHNFDYSKLAKSCHSSGNYLLASHKVHTGSVPG